MSEQQGRIREQIGRIEAKVDALADRIRDIKQAAQETEQRQSRERENIWVAIRDVKHDHRNELVVLYARLDKQDREIAQIGIDVQAQAAAVADIKEAIDGPINSAVAFQRRLTGIGVLVLAIGTLIWNTRDFISEFLMFVFRLGQGPK